MSQKIAITSLKLETHANRPRVNYAFYNEEKGLPGMKEITKGEACDVGANYGVKVP